MIRKAVILAGGRGTRFLPYTKGVAKEMLAIVDKPVLHYLVEEVVSAGISDILIIDTKDKTEIRKYFCEDKELEDFLTQRGKTEDLKTVRAISSMAKITGKHQLEQKGSGDAVLLAEEFACGESVAILNGDDIMYTDEGLKSCVGQLIESFNKNGKTVIGVHEVSDEELVKYSAISYTAKDGREYSIDSIVEKPKLETAPSKIASIGRYVCTADIFAYIKKTPPAPNGEIFFTDALKLMAEEKGIIGYEYEAKHYDTGDKLGYLKTIVEFALKNKNFGVDFAEYIKELSKTL